MITGVPFKDGIELEPIDQIAAWSIAEHQIYSPANWPNLLYQVKILGVNLGALVKQYELESSQNETTWNCVHIRNKL